jgi:hypothetical protein
MPKVEAQVSIQGINNQQAIIPTRRLTSDNNIHAKGYSIPDIVSAGSCGCCHTPCVPPQPTPLCVPPPQPPPLCCHGCCAPTPNPAACACCMHPPDPTHSCACKNCK